MGDLAPLKEIDALAHGGVADDDARARVGQVARGVEGGDERPKIVAIHLLRVPAEGGPFRRLGPDRQRIARRPVGLLTARAFGDMTRMDTNFLAVSTGMARTSLLRSAHDADQAVYVWTVNDAALMSDLIARGFDGLITDNPALAREMIARHETLSPVHRLMLLAGSRLGLTD